MPSPSFAVCSILLFPVVLQLLIMGSFVATVDEAPTTPEVQEAVVAALVMLGLPTLSIW